MAIFMFVLMLHINTKQLEIEFNSDSKLQINMFKDWLSLNVSEVEKLSHFLSAVDEDSEEKMFHILVHHTIERDVFNGIYLVKVDNITARHAQVISAVTRGRNPDDLLLQSSLTTAIINSITTRKPAATAPITFAGDTEEDNKIAVIFPLLRAGQATEAIVALLDPGARFEAIRDEESFDNTSEYIFDVLEDGTEKMFYGKPDAFMHKAFLYHDLPHSEIISNTAAFSYHETIHLFSQQWKVIFIPTSKYISRANTFAPWIVMATCVLLSGMTGAFLFHLIGQNVRTEHTIRERTLDLLYTSNQLKARSIDLQSAKEAAEAANKAKSDFLANISHEMRTPLSSMIGLADLVMETELTVQQKSHISTILSSGEILLELINDMLDFSKIEAGKLELDPIAFDLQTAIEDMLELFAPKARAKDRRLDLLVRFVSGTPRHLIGDVMRVKQILANLINNAIKFTEEGHILITAEKMADIVPANAVKIKISVQDTGIGIPKDKLNIIFEKFTQADTSTTRKFGGTGLGLSICRQLAEMMQGEVIAESIYGKGSSFSFSMVLKLDKEAQEKEPPSYSPILKDKKALLVDDAEPSHTLLAEQLSNAGLISSGTDNFPAALKMLEEAREAKTPFDLLIIDGTASEASNEAFIKRAKERCPDMHIIITSLAEKGCTHLFINGICDACLLKPIRKSQLISMLEAVFLAKRSGKNTSVPIPAAISGKKHTPVPTEDNVFLKNAEILLVEDNKPNRELGIKLLENLSCHPTAVHNGEEAVEIVKKRTFDLILMDCQMPEMDGFEASSILRRMKEHGEIADIPIIALTANAMKGDKERCLASGMNDYLTKPLRKGALHNILMEWLPPLEKRLPKNGDDASV